MKSMTYGSIVLASLLTACLIQPASAESLEPKDPPPAESGDPSVDSEEHEKLSTAAPCGNPCDRCECDGECQRWVNRGDPSLTFGDWWRGDATRQIAAGITGSAGVTEQLDIVSGFDAKRAWGLHSIFTDLDYFYSNANGGTTKNRLYSLTRYEHGIYNTPYSWYGDSWFEYDQFEDFEVRIAYHAGLIRTWVKTDRQVFRTLAGLGAAKAFAGPNQEWIPEPQFGAQYELKVNSRQKFYWQALYYPELTDPSLFRLNIKAGWEVKISDVRDISLRLWAFNRYDNTDLVSANPNALDYSASLVWGF